MNPIMRFGLLLTVLLILSCTKIDKAAITESKKYGDTTFIGNWYADLQDDGGFYGNDSLINYCEIYMTDSLHKSFNESMGLLPESAYYVKGDSLFICFYSAYSDCQNPIGLKILSISYDTIWLSVHPNNPRPIKKSYLVRVSANEKGFFDYDWTKENSDSLYEILSIDYDRRRWKFYSIRAGDMRGYDSALKAGYWDPHK